MFRRLRRLLRRLLGLLFLLLALAVLGGKLYLEADGPYLETMAPYPYCGEASAALADGRYQDAIELAEAGGCGEELAAAEAAWNSFGAVVGRCAAGVWTGRADDGAGIACSVASDLVVFGDVRDLTRQGLARLRGEPTDPVLIALSAAGLAMTITPQLGAGASLLKGARRAGALSEPLARSVTKQVQERAWRQVGGMLSDAGRLSAKLGPAKATRVLAYADDATELRALAKFAESAPSPLLGLRWGGKRVARLSDDALYGEALRRGPGGVQLAVERGGRALLVRNPAVVFIAKTAYKNPEVVLAVLLALAAFLLNLLTWPLALMLAGALALVGWVFYLSGRKLPPPRRRMART